MSGKTKQEKEVQAKETPKEPTKKTIQASESDKMDIVEGEKCPMCLKDTLTLMESEKDIPYFGKVYLFSMSCTNKECNYHKADIEAAEQREPCKYTLDVTSDKDLSIRVVKSAEATVRIPRIMDIEPGTASNGYVTNVEGILNRVKMMLEKGKDDAEDEDDKEKIRAMLKKINRVLWGSDSIKIIIEDPTGNSAIISEKAVKGKL
jgi:zinc finger protein